MQRTYAYIRSARGRAIAFLTAIFAIAAVCAFGIGSESAFAAEGDVYAYIEGTELIIQTDDPLREENQWKVEGPFDSAANVPWQGSISSVEKVTFKAGTDKVKPQSLAYWFSGASALTQVDTAGLDPSSVTSVREMFNGCQRLNDISLTGLVTSSVKDMSGMFKECRNLHTITGMASWDTSAVTDMSYIFSECHGLQSLEDISAWRVENVTTIANGFYHCAVLPKIELTGWHPTALKTIDHAFTGCTGLHTLSLESADGSFAPTSAVGPFEDCTNLRTLNLDGWDVTNLDSSHLQGLFTGHGNLETLSVDRWTLGNMDQSIFTNLKNTIINISADDWKLGEQTTLKNLFSGLSKLQTISVKNWDMSNVTDISGMFNDCAALTELDLSSWKNFAPTAANAFAGCSALETLTINGWDVSEITGDNLKAMFPAALTGLHTLNMKGCTVGDIGGSHGGTGIFGNLTNLTSLNADDWTFDEGVTSLSYVFSGLTNLTSLSAKWTLPETVTDLSYAFSGCSSLASLGSDITGSGLLSSGWDVSHVENMQYMFSGCSSLGTVNLGAWKTEKLSNISYMFQNCSALKELDLSGWNGFAPTAAANAFDGCKLKTLDISNWDVSQLTALATVQNIFTGLTADETDGLTIRAEKWAPADTVLTASNAASIFNAVKDQVKELDLKDWKISGGG